MIPRGQAKSRARRAAAAFGSAVATVVVFVAATVTAVLLHLDLPASRRLVAAEVNLLLDSTFAGDVTIEHIAGLDLSGASGVRGRVEDRDGVQVLSVSGLRARISALDVARSALFGTGDVVIRLLEVEADHVDVSIDSDGAGELRLAKAFEVESAAPPEDEPVDPHAREVRVELAAISVTHAWIHGRPPGALPVDADLANLSGSARFGPHLTRVHLEDGALVSRGLPASLNPRGAITGHLRVPSATAGAALALDGAFDGTIAGVATVAQASLDGARLDGTVEARDPSGRAIRSAFGEIAVQEQLTLHAEVHGVLPRMGAKAELLVGRRGSVEVDANIDTRELRVDGSVAARNIDLRALLSSAPRSDVGLNAGGWVALRESGDVEGEVSLATVRGQLAGVPLPLLGAHATFGRGALHATGQVTDATTNAELELDVGPTGEGGMGKLAEAQLRANVEDLSRVPIVGAKGANVRGHASVTAQVRTVLARGAMPLYGRVHARGGGIAFGAQHVEDVSVLATATGTMREPVIEVGIHGAGLRSGAIHAASMDVRGSVEPGENVVIRDAHVDVVESMSLLSATASRVEVGKAHLAIEDAIVHGLGEPIHGSLSRAPEELHVTVDGPSIDLARVGAVLGRERDLRKGRLRIHGDVALAGKSARGELRVEVDGATVADVDGASLKVDATLDGERLGVEAHGEVADGQIDAKSKLVIAGRPTDARSWRNAWGRARFSGSLEMATLRSLLPDDALPVGELVGRLTVAGVFRRDSASVPPELSVHAHTRGLVVSGATARDRTLDGLRLTGVAPWRSAGADVAVDIGIDATSGLGAAAFHVFDQEGTLLAFDAKAYVPYADIVSDPSRGLGELKTAPFRAKLVVPKRALASLPNVLGTGRFPGNFEAEVDVSGTALAPHLALIAHARGIGGPTLPIALASDADLVLGYDGDVASLKLTVRSGDREIAAASSHLELRARDLLAAAREPLDWKASARVELAGFPLEMGGAIARRRLRGQVSGVAVLQNLHRDATAAIALRVEDLRIGRSSYPRGRIDVEARKGKLVGSARVDQTDGYAAVRAKTDLRWGRALLPELDAGGQVEAHVAAKSFRIGGALPFVRELFHALDGRIDADATLTAGAGQTTLQGRASLSDGVVQLVAAGPVLRDVRARATMQPNGEIRIADVYGRGNTGELRANGVVKTRGLAFESARAEVAIPKAAPLDMSVQGQPLGQVFGKATLEAAPRGDGIAMKVNVPELHLTVPRTDNADIQSLSRNPDIHVGVFRDPDHFVALPLEREDAERPDPASSQETPLDIDVHLAAVEVVYGRMARIFLRGDPHVRVAGDETTITGKVEVTRGKVELQGKEFEVDRATVTFRPEAPSNPIVVASTSWQAQDGTVVHADFVGPVETGKVTLRSDPPRPRNEIVALIVFGIADGANATPNPARTPGAASAAVSLGGGLAAQGLTEAIDDLTGVQATARVDTSRANNPAPEIEIQIAQRLSVEYSHVLGTPPLSRPDKNLVTLEWRVARKWSLELTVGDRGTVQSDAIWQKRY